jgi:ribosome-binding ATPase YchF (GTP1/OBG family)
LESKKALKLIKAIIEDLNTSGIQVEKQVENIKKLRALAVEEEQPVVAKSLRLVYEHLEEFETFVAPIPQEEVFDEDGELIEQEKVTGSDSLVYLMNLIKQCENKLNLSEIREYNSYLEDFSI